MGIALTTGQVAEELTELLATNDGHPTITGEKVLTLIHAGLFPNVGLGKQFRVDRDKVVALAKATRYVAHPEEVADLIFRVSVIKYRDSVCHDLDGNVLRTHAGVDYTNPALLGGVEGVWKLSLHNANRLVAEGGILLATAKGYVHPEHVREVVSWEHVKDTARRYFHTKVASAMVREAVGSGIWIDVPPGRESDILVG
ncbi:hypothetical protein K7711_02620 [Nocardia sp. CA2R105]|uniref:hypothetical protein n=1 Tax=Nocardia coffeae TaxID=2873381 RepID=UPI001CA650FC|nr:hypothetical protein [Nocardia coffeae]MBY8855361.1 hypothetical protein [Nocardia coffeae]